MLPPGQRRIDEFPRFGTHLNRPPPPIPDDPVIEISGAVTEPVVFPVADLATLPRTDRTADFHCVSGWTATDLHWDGVTFADFHRKVIEPALRADVTITHVVFGGLDGFESAACLEDALADDVLIADRLDGRPLDPDHGAPVRLVSPSQYGYISTKHLCSIRACTQEPKRLRAAHPIAQLGLRGPLVMRHPRARVWEEERHPYVPGRWLRGLYRLAIRPGMAISRRAPDEEEST